MAFDKLKKMLGDDTEEENDNYYSIDEGKGTKASVNTNQNVNTNNNTNAEPSNQMILIEPRAYSESQAIADHLKARNTVVVNLKRVTSNQAKRIIDFLTGTLYAIGGDLQKIGPGIYLCTPKDVKVQGKISDDDKPKETKDDEIDW